MGFSLVGLLLLSVAGDARHRCCSPPDWSASARRSFIPESSRVARMASGGRHGLAQSVFQVGGNIGSSLGPLLAAFLVRAARAIEHRVVLAASRCSRWSLLWQVGGWSAQHVRASTPARPQPAATPTAPGLSRRRVALAIAVLVALIFSKYFYLASLSSYYTFYLISKFHVSVRAAQIDLFIFLGAVAAGTILGGPIGDRFGRKS